MTAVGWWWCVFYSSSGWILTVCVTVLGLMFKEKQSKEEQCVYVWVSLCVKKVSVESLQHFQEKQGSHDFLRGCTDINHTVPLNLHVMWSKWYINSIRANGSELGVHAHSQANSDRVKSEQRKSSLICVTNAFLHQSNYRRQLHLLWHPHQIHQWVKRSRVLTTRLCLLIHPKLVDKSEN